MIVSGGQIASWAIGILGTVIANIITFLLYIVGTKIGWFQKITVHLENKVIPLTINKEVTSLPKNNVPVPNVEPVKIIVPKPSNPVPHLILNHGRVK
jgi:hypothetical protein